MKLFKRLSVFIVLLALLSCAGGAKIASSGLGKAGDPVPFMEKAKTGVLPSGLRYYLLENSRPEGRVYLTLAVNAGSVLEMEEERGLAHFVEHMAFNGTARFQKSELIDYLRSLGMRFGPEVNAYTSFDETVYGIEVPTDLMPGGLRRVPDRALAVIDDWAWTVSFRPEDVESEKLVILEEYRSRLGARDRMNRQIFPLLFRGSPYAERLPIGLSEVIENATAAQLEGFYKKWYRPENMAIIIVGDFDADYLEAQLADHFPSRQVSEGVFTRPRHNLPEPVKGSLHSLVLTDPELSRSRIDLYWKRKAEVRKPDLGSYRESIIDNLVYTMLSLRFQDEAAKSATPYVWAGAGMANFGHSSRYYVLAAQPKTDSVTASLRELLLTKESLSRFGFTGYELKMAGASLVSYMEQAVSEKDFQSSEDYVRSFTQHFLRAETVPDLEWELEAVNALLGGITLREVNRTVKNYFVDDDLTIIITAPEDELGLPGSDDIKAIVAETRRARLTAPQREKPSGELLAYIPEPGTIVSEVIDSETGAVRIVLGNGAEVIFKETNNKNSEVSFYAQARGGVLSAPSEMAVSAALAAEMLNASGLGSFSRTELVKLLLDKQVSLSFWTQNYLRGFQGSSSVKDIKTLFEMIYVGFTQPSLDPEAVEAMLDQRRSNMIFQENDPNTVFRREITRTIFGNPVFHPLVAEDLDKADMNEAMAFIGNCFNPGDYAFVFTGNLDLPLFRSLALNYIASIKPSASFNEWANLDPQRPSAVEKEIRRGREDRSTVYMSWFCPEPFSEEKSAAVSALSEYLDIRLTDEIRENLGGVYSISAWTALSPIPSGELSGGASFVCDPRRAEELSRAVREEFIKIAEGKIDTGVFNKAVEALVQGHEQSIQSNLYIAQSYANSAVIYHSPLSRLDKRPSLFRALRPADIEKAASELLGGSFVRLFLYPEI